MLPVYQSIKAGGSWGKAVSESISYLMRSLCFILFVVGTLTAWVLIVFHSELAVHRATERGVSPADVDLLKAEARKHVSSWFRQRAADRMGARPQGGRLSRGDVDNSEERA